MRTILLALGAVAVSAATAAPAGAQLPTLRPPGDTALRTVAGGGSLVYAQPVGPFHDNVKGGGGAEGHLLVRVGTSGALALRVDGGFIVYGHERVRANNPISGRLSLDVTTTNNIVVAGVGPQIMLPTGRVRPYVNGSVGLAYFYTQSSLSGDDDNIQVLNTMNSRDSNLAWAGGGGLYIPLTAAQHPVSIDVGARYHGNGRAEYLTEDSIIDNPDGSVIINAIRGDANFVSYHLGVTVGF